MGRVGTFVSGMITGAILLYVANHYHIVRSDKGLFAIPKLNQTLKDTYVDVRDFSLRDWQAHPMLAASILGSEHKEILEDTSLSGFRNKVGSMVSEFLGET